MIYELGYLVLPTLPEEQVAPEVSKIKEILEKHDAKVVSDEYPVLIELAYTITKRVNNKNARFDTGYFGWVKFEATPEVMADIKKELDRNATLLRFMLIKTVRENTISSKRPLSSNIVTRSSRAPKSETENAGKIDEAQVDSEIDKLVEDVSEAPGAAEAPEVAEVPVKEDSEVAEEAVKDEE